MDLAATPGRKRGRVAVIGAGPSSLTVAHDLALLGHQVVIYEAGPKAGGMIRYGVPIYRIDQQALDAEIESILAMGVEIHYHTPIGRDITLADLRQQYDAVYLGLGLMEGRRLNIEGADLDGVITAVDLLLNYNLGYRVQLGKRVIVVGGGDVAMDAARTALRLGQLTAAQAGALAESEARAEEEADAVHAALDVARTALRLGVADVRLIALESWEEMPASRFEIEEALEEGIQICSNRTTAPEPRPPCKPCANNGRWAMRRPAPPSTAPIALPVMGFKAKAVSAQACITTPLSRGRRTPNWWISCSSGGRARPWPVSKAASTKPNWPM